MGVLPPSHPRKEDERKRLLELRAKKAQEAKNAKKGKAWARLFVGAAEIWTRDDDE